MRRMMRINLAVCALIVSVAAFAQESRRPNIVLMVADDMGWKDLGCYGATDIRTPQLDRLAAEGIRFTSFYANGPECTPTRTALLTGRYQQRVGGMECAIGTGNVGRYDEAIRLAARGELGLPVEELTISRVLKDAGYVTAIFGKWHLGYDAKFAPGGHGFDESIYCLGGGMDFFHHTEEPPKNDHVLRRNGQVEKRDGYFTDLIADESVKFIERNAARPFFLYVPFTAPHAPYQGPDDRREGPLPDGSPLWKQDQAPPAVYAAMVQRMDEAVGRIVQTLARHGLERDTLVIFISDNGGTASARPTGLRGLKGTTFEGGIRVPCIVRWPARIKPGQTSDLPGLTMDLTASIAGAAAVKVKPRTFDGIDILAQVEKGDEAARTLFWRGRRGDKTWRAAREGTLKLVVQQTGEKLQEYLFDIRTDPGEKEDLLATRTADAERLRKALADWEREVKPARGQ